MRRTRSRQSVRTRAALPRRSRAWPSAPACSGSSARTASSGASTREHKSEEHRPRGGPAHLCEFRAGELPPDIAYGLESLWIVNRAANAIVRIDPVTNQNLGDLSTGRAPRAIAIGPRTLWIANFDDDTVTRITIPERSGRRSLRRRSRWATAGRRRRRRGRRLGRLEARSSGDAARSRDGGDRGDDRARQRAAACGRGRRCSLGQRPRTGAGGWLERSQPRLPPCSSSPSRARAARPARRGRGAAARSCSRGVAREEPCLNTFLGCSEGINRALPHYIFSTVLPGAFREGPGGTLLPALVEPDVECDEEASVHSHLSHPARGSLERRGTCQRRRLRLHRQDEPLRRGRTRLPYCGRPEARRRRSRAR